MISTKLINMRTIFVNHYYSILQNTNTSMIKYRIRYIVDNKIHFDIKVFYCKYSIVATNISYVIWHLQR